MKRIWGLSIFILANFFMNSGYAGPFKLSRTGINPLLPTVVKDTLNTFFDEAETNVNSNLPNADASTYLNGMSDAAILTTKGLGTDYASNMDLFVIGGGVGAGLDLPGTGFSDVFSGKVNSQNFRGIGLQTSFMAGLQLGVFHFPVFWEYFDLNKMSVYLNAMSLDLPKFKEGFSGKLSNFGFHLQYKVMQPISFGTFLFSWGGVDFTTGFETSTLTIKYARTDTITQSSVVAVPVAGLGTVNDTVNTNITANSQVGANVSSTTIPLEISTNIRFLYLFSLFGGLAMDINSGSSSALAAVNTNLTVTDTRSILTGANAVTSSGSLDLGQSGKPTGSNFRWFSGLQLNLTIVKLYLQLNKAVSQDTLGFGAGVRIAW